MEDSEQNFERIQFRIDLIKLYRKLAKLKDPDEIIDNIHKLSRFHWFRADEILPPHQKTVLVAIAGMFGDCENNVFSGYYDHEKEKWFSRVLQQEVPVKIPDGYMHLWMRIPHYMFQFSGGMDEKEAENNDFWLADIKFQTKKIEKKRKS